MIEILSSQEVGSSVDKSIIDEFWTFTIGISTYIAWPNHKQVPFVPALGQYLATVLPITLDTQISKSWLQDFMQTSIADDVLTSNFLAAIIVHGPVDADQELDSEVLALLQNWNTKWIKIVDSRTNSVPLCPGPNFIYDGSLQQVWRLFEDSINAFTVATKPQFLDSRRQCTEIVELRTQASQYQRRSVVIPSRLITNATAERPLDGLRMVVKDMFKIENHRTSLGSRAYTELYDPSTSTAPAIQDLIRKGAILVGLTQLCAMVGTADPTQCIDFQAPFNPRGEGYQSPSGGSSGQASAIAAYTWLDFAIGSDTTTSGRMPAQVNGCFSIRPSCGLIPTEGMWSGFPPFDTPCVFSRSIATLAKVAHAWYGDRTPIYKKQLPRVLLCSSDTLPEKDSPDGKVFSKVLQDMRRNLDLQAKMISLPILWDEQRPEEAEGLSLDDFLNEFVGICTYVYNFWQKIKAFDRDYTGKFFKTPFMPPPKGIHLWDPAMYITPDQHEKALSRMRIYRRWLLDIVIKPSTQDALVIMPLGKVEVNYRDRWPVEKGPQKLGEPLLLAPILSAPEVVIPVGQIEYQSCISSRQEHLPMCVSIMGQPGSDIRLLELVHNFLEKSGRSVEVLTGSKIAEFE